MIRRRAVETTRRTVGDIFNGRVVVAQTGVSQSRSEPSTLPMEFAVEQQAEPFSMVEFCAARVIGQFLKARVMPAKPS